MKDTPFSIEVKKALINFGGAKTLSWNLSDINIADDSMSFGVKTSEFDGFFSVASMTHDKSKIAATYCKKSEIDLFNNKEDFKDFMQSRTVVISINEIAKFVSQKVEVIGQRAPQCCAVPNSGQ